MDNEKDLCNDNKILFLDRKRMERSARLHDGLKAECLRWEAEGYSKYEIRSTLVELALRRLASNPYRDPVDVETVEQDRGFLWGAMSDMQRWMTQLEAALTRAETQR